MREKVGIIRIVGQQFLKRSGPQDEYFLEYAGEVPSVQYDFTSDLARIRPGLDRFPTRGGSAILDGIDAGLAAIRRAHNLNRSLLVISDGGDNSSALGGDAVTRTLLNTPVPIFLLIPVPGPEAGSFNKQGKADILRLVTRSGGFALSMSERDSENAALNIATAIRSPYVLDFVSQRSGKAFDPQKIKVEVKGIRPRPSVFVGVAVPSPR